MNREVLALFLLFLVFTSFLFFEEQTKDVFYGVIEQPSFFLSRMGIQTSSVASFLARFREIEKENRELREENRDLKSEIASLLILRSENDFLRQALEIGDRKDFQFAFSKVVFRNFSEDLMFINKGRDAGLEPGMVVVDSRKNLVGEVDEVLDNFSRVRLMTKTEETTPVYFGEDQTTAELRGEGALSSLLTLIPMGEEVKEGDLVFTAGLSQDSPAGILVGEVDKTIISDVKPYKEARLRSAAPLKELEFVFVITDY